MSSFSCLACESVNTSIIRSAVNSGGCRRRLVRCRDCGHCSLYLDDQPLVIDRNIKRKYHRSYRFSDAVIRQVLLSQDSHATVAATLGCSTEAIRLIRVGRSYRQCVPDIPRWSKRVAVADAPNCRYCVHWAGSQCGLGFPDPLQEGLQFAKDCSMYEQG